MGKNKFYMLAGLLGLLITTFTVSSMVSASQGNGQGKSFDPERHEAMQEKREEMNNILESGDYDAWAELVAEKECVKKRECEKRM